MSEQIDIQKSEEPDSQVERLLSAGTELADYVTASRTTNTPEYMEDLVFYLNNFFKAGDKEERYLFDGKDAIIKSS